MDVFQRLVTSRIFLSAVFSWFIAQLLKSIIEIVKDRPHSATEILVHLFWTTGGMPSSHSAVVTAIPTAIGFEMGPDNPIFVVTLFYAILVIRDALGVRRAAGYQAKTLNTIITELAEKNLTQAKQVKEIHGHTVAEVSVGMVLGFFIAVAFCNL